MNTRAIDLYQERGEEFERFLGDYYRDEIGELQRKFPNDQSRLVIDWNDVFRWDSDVADDAIANTDVIRDCFALALQAFDAGADVDLTDATIQFVNAGDPRQIPALEGDDVGNLLNVRAQVSKASAIKPRLTVATIRCRECGHMMEIPQPTNGVNKPKRCHGTDCGHSDFEAILEQSEFERHQLIRLKEPPEEADGDEHIDVYLRGDAAGTATVGDRADVTGVLRADFDGFETTVPDFYLVGDALQMHSSDYEDIDITDRKEKFEAIASGVRGDPFQKLVESIAPSIQGGEKMDTIKLAIALQLFGGWRRPLNDGRYVRGDSHVGIIGAPGTGKSSLLEAAEKISPRSGYVSGKNATQAGITAAAVRDDFGDAEWSLEAGAVVKAHKGLCCIDEIDKVDGAALSSLHTALEKQRLEFNKAGIDASLRCETSILAAGNPENGHFIEEYKVLDQLNMGSTLRSRFDLLFTLRDEPDREKDTAKSTHTQKMRQLAGLVENGDAPDDAAMLEPAVDIDTLRAWVAYARENVHPVIEDDSMIDEVAEWFATQRNDAGNQVNLRIVDGINRLAEASARVRLSETVNRQDVERARRIVEQSLTDLQLLGDNSDWVGHESGVDEETREMKRGVKGILENLMSGPQDGIPVDELVDTCVSAGHDETDVRNEIERMCDHAVFTRDGKNGEVRSLDY
jgi:replicative DNA helicase Mcm